MGSSVRRSSRAERPCTSATSAKAPDPVWTIERARRWAESRRAAEETLGASGRAQVGASQRSGGGVRRSFAMSLPTALADPAVHTDLARARKVGRRYAELTPIVRALDEYDRLTADLAAARELATEDEAFAIEAADLERQLESVDRAADPAARAARPQRLLRRFDRDQVRGGRRGVGPVRRRPAEDVHPLRREPRLEDRDPGRPGDRSGRLQVGDRRRSRRRPPAARKRCRTGC